jgi:hypothetical protein
VVAGAAQDPGRRTALACQPPAARAADWLVPPACQAPASSKAEVAEVLKPARLAILYRELRKWISPREVDTGVMRSWSMVAG